MPQPGYKIQRAEVIGSITGSRKVGTPFLELSKLQLYIAFHAVFMGAVLLYQSVWLFGKTTHAYCYAYNEAQLVSRGESPGTLVYHYMAGERMFRATTTRDELPLTQHTIKVRYLSFYPEISRPDTFEGTWLGYIIAWGIFFVITSMIFFIPNETMPRNSYFYFTKRKPWIHMIVK
ncbi:hypothetical protein BH11BAC4_BH11BAC4_24710 [soil metagenome]